MYTKLTHQDIASLGRLVGIDYFFSEQHLNDSKEDAAAIRRARKELDDGETLVAEQLRIVRRLQKHYQHFFLRRTSASLDPEGNGLLQLPPFVEIIGIVALTEREVKIIQERSEAAKAA